jgi:hypothetical protein
LNFEIPVDSNEVDFINTKLPLVTQKLAVALALFLQDSHRREVVPIGHGMDAATVIESAIKKEKAAAEHERLFGHGAAIVEEIQQNVTLNTMVQPRKQ